MAILTALLAQERLTFNMIDLFLKPYRDLHCRNRPLQVQTWQLPHINRHQPQGGVPLTLLLRDLRRLPTGPRGWSPVVWSD